MALRIAANAAAEITLRAVDARRDAPSGRAVAMASGTRLAGMTLAAAARSVAASLPAAGAYPVDVRFAAGALVAGLPYRLEIAVRGASSPGGAGAGKAPPRLVVAFTG